MFYFGRRGSRVQVQVYPNQVQLPRERQTGILCQEKAGRPQESADLPPGQAAVLRAVAGGLSGFDLDKNQIILRGIHDQVDLAPGNDEIAFHQTVSFGGQKLASQLFPETAQRFAKVGFWHIYH